MDPANPSPVSRINSPPSSSESSSTPSRGPNGDLGSHQGFGNSLITPMGNRHPLEDVSLTPDNFSYRSVSPTTVLTVDSSQSCFTISEDLTEYIEDQRSAVKFQQNHRVFGRAQPSTMGEYVIADRGRWKSRMRDFAGVSLLDPEHKRPSQSTYARSGLDPITEEDQAFERQRVLYEEKYYLNLVKTNLWLSMVSKGGELVTCAVTGFKDGFTSWLSNALQLLFNVLSSCFLLWRYRGQFSTSKTDAALHRVRERLCIFFQSFCKLLSATTLLVYTILVLAGTIDQLPNQTDTSFIRTSMLTGGVSTGGSLTRAALAVWLSWLLRKPLPPFTKSVSSENKLTWINTLLSLKNAIVSFCVSYAGDNPEQIKNIMLYSNAIDAILGIVSVYYGLIDAFFGYRDRTSERNETAAADQMERSFAGDDLEEIDTASHSAPLQKDIMF